MTRAWNKRCLFSIEPKIGARHGRSRQQWHPAVSILYAGCVEHDSIGGVALRQVDDAVIRLTAFSSKKHAQFFRSHTLVEKLQDRRLVLRGLEIHWSS